MAAITTRNSGSMPCQDMGQKTSNVQLISTEGNKNWQKSSSPLSSRPIILSTIAYTSSTGNNQCSGRSIRKKKKKELKGIETHFKQKLLIIHFLCLKSIRRLLGFLQ
uniref:Putative ovule protein n=1 Tax=Solanum chacoense TaxID=4108 RepID=A0A0V0HV39_SOLCH